MPWDASEVETKVISRVAIVGSSKGLLDSVHRVDSPERASLKSGGYLKMVGAGGGPHQFFAIASL
jgi:hypothetical protein